MGPTPDVDACAQQITTLRARLRDQLDGAAPTGTAQNCGADVGALVALTDDIRWCRDAATVIARRAGRSWGGLEYDTGVPDATLDGRAQRFTEREGRT